MQGLFEGSSMFTCDVKLCSAAVIYCRDSTYFTVMKVSMHFSSSQLISLC